MTTVRGKLSQQNRVTKIFDDQSNSYAQGYIGETSQSHSFNIRRERIFSMLNGVAGSMSLDVGCGPGIMAEYFLNRGYEYHGVDISEKMIIESKRLYGSMPSASFSVGKIENLDYPDETFDVVSCMGVVEYIDNDQIALKELSRVAKRGGTIIISLPNIYSPYRLWDKRVFAVVKHVLGIVFNIKIKPFINHREYRENVYCKKIESYSLKIEDVVYYNFKIILPPLDRYFPKTTVMISRYLEKLCRSRIRWLATGFIVKAKKI